MVGEGLSEGGELGEELLHILGGLAAKGGYGQITGPIKGLILQRAGTFQGTLERKEGVRIWVHVIWSKCEKTWCHWYSWDKHYDWKGHDKWVRSNAGDNKSLSGLGFAPSNINGITNAVPGAIRQAVQEVTR